MAVLVDAEYARSLANKSVGKQEEKNALDQPSIARLNEDIIRACTYGKKSISIEGHVINMEAYVEELVRRGYEVTYQPAPLHYSVYVYRDGKKPQAKGSGNWTISW